MMNMKQTEDTANWGSTFDTVLEAVTHLGIFGANGASAVECARMATGIITESLQGKVVSRDLAAQVIQTSLRESQTKSKIQRVKESSPRLAGKVLAESVIGKLATSRKELTSISHLYPMGDAYVPVAGLHPSLMENITKAVTRTLGELSGHYYDAERVGSLVSAYDIDGSDGSHWLMEVVSRGPLPVNGYSVLLTNPRGLSFVVGGGTLNVGQHPYLNTPTLTEAVGKSEFNDQEYFNASAEDLEEFSKPNLSGIKQRWQELTTPTKKEVKQRYKTIKTGLKTLKPKDVGVSRRQMKKNMKKEAEKQVRFAKKAQAVGTIAGEAARRVSGPVKLAAGAVGTALLLRAIKNRKKKKKRDEYGRYLESLEEAKQGQRYRGLKNRGGRPGYSMPIGQQATLDAMNSEPFVHTPPSVAKRPDKYFMANVDEPSNNLAERFPSQIVLHQQQMYNRDPEAIGNIPKSVKPFRKSTISALTPHPAGLGYRLRDQLGAVAEDELDEYGDYPYPMDYGQPMGRFAAREIGDIEREPSKLQPGVKIPRALMDRYEQSAEKMIDNLEHQKRRKFTDSERKAYKIKFINHMIRMRRLHYEDIIEACKTRGKKKNEAVESPEKLAGDVMTRSALNLYAGKNPKRALSKHMRYSKAFQRATLKKDGTTWQAQEDVDEAICPITGKEIPPGGRGGKGLGLRRLLRKGRGPIGEAAVLKTRKRQYRSHPLPSDIIIAPSTPKSRRIADMSTKASGKFWDVMANPRTTSKELSREAYRHGRYTSAMRRSKTPWIYSEEAEQIDEAWPKRPKRTRTKRTRKHKMPHFLSQHRPRGVKRIYKALTRGGKPKEMRRRYGAKWKGVAARIASRQGPPGPQPQGAPYKGKLIGRRRASMRESMNEDFRSDYRQALQVQQEADIGSKFAKQAQIVAGRDLTPEKELKIHKKFKKNIEQAKAGRDVREEGIIPMETIPAARVPRKTPADIAAERWERAKEIQQKATKKWREAKKGRLPSRLVGEDNVAPEYSGNPNDMHRQGTGPVVSRSTTSDKQGKKGSRRGYMGEFRHDHPLHQVAFQGAPKVNKLDETDFTKAGLSIGRKRMAKSKEISIGRKQVAKYKEIVKAAKERSKESAKESRDRAAEFAKEAEKLRHPGYAMENKLSEAERKRPGRLKQKVQKQLRDIRRENIQKSRDEYNKKMMQRSKARIQQKRKERMNSPSIGEGQLSELSPERKMLVSQGLAEQPDVGFVFPANATDQGANVPIRSYGLKRKKTINKMEAHGVNRIPLARLKDRLAPIDNPMTVAQVQGGGGTMERMQNMVLPTGGGKEAGQYVKLREGIFSKKKKKRKRADVIDVGGGMRLNLAQLTQGVQHQRIFNPMMMGEAAGDESPHVVSRGNPGGYMTRYYAPESRPLGRADRDVSDEALRTILAARKKKKRRQREEESVADLRAVKRMVVDHVVRNSDFPQASVEEAVNHVLESVDFGALCGLQGRELTEAHRELSRSIVPYVHKVLSGETDELGEDQVKREVIACVITELVQEHQVPKTVAARALGRVFHGVELNIATEQDFHEAVDYLVEVASPEIENALFEDANVTGRMSSNLMELLAKHGLSPEEALGFGRSRLLSLGFSPLDIIDLKRNFDWRGIKKPAPGGNENE